MFSYDYDQWSTLMLQFLFSVTMHFLFSFFYSVLVFSSCHALYIHLLFSSYCSPLHLTQYQTYTIPPIDLKWTQHCNFQRSSCSVFRNRDEVISFLLYLISVYSFPYLLTFEENPISHCDMNHIKCTTF